MKICFYECGSIIVQRCKVQLDNQMTLNRDQNASRCCGPLRISEQSNPQFPNAKLCPSAFFEKIFDKGVLMEPPAKRRGRRPIPKEGLYARYITLGKNDYGTQVVSEYFGKDGGALINAIDHAIDLVDVCEINAKIYIDGKKVFDGEAWEVRSLPQLAPYLTPGWKSNNTLRREERIVDFYKRDHGEIPITATCYPGDVLRPFDDNAAKYVKRPEIFDDPQTTFKEPYTIEYSYHRSEDPFDYEHRWTIVEKSELSNWKGNQAEIPLDVYKRPATHYTNPWRTITLAVENNALRVAWSE